MRDPVSTVSFEERPGRGREAEKSQLERTVVRVKIHASLEEVLQSLTKAFAEVDQRDFGRAE